MIILEKKVKTNFLELAWRCIGKIRGGD